MGPLDEFRDMVKALHRAGIEVILDVVYNHTAEGDEDGPTLCFKGLENEIYYILDQDDPLVWAEPCVSAWPWVWDVPSVLPFELLVKHPRCRQRDHLPALAIYDEPSYVGDEYVLSYALSSTLIILNIKSAHIYIIIYY